jgi:hypothetical protein
VIGYRFKSDGWLTLQNARRAHAASAPFAGPFREQRWQASLQESATLTTATPTVIRDPWQRVWHIVTGDVFLTIVLVVLGALLGLSAWLPQTPQGDPVAYSRWLSETQQRFGNFTNPLMALGLFSITASAMFRIASGALAAACALRLIDQIDRLRSFRTVSGPPARPSIDSVLPINLETCQARLNHYHFQSSDDWLIGERHQRRAAIAALIVWTGALIVLLGLAIGTWADQRTDQIAVAPNTVTPIRGTAYALRLDALTKDHATLALLNATEPIVQGDVAPKQPLAGVGLAIYLEDIQPALVMSATNSHGQPLGLQSTADAPARTEEFVAFNAGLTEQFVAIPDADIVLQIGHATGDRYTVQVLQSATGKVLTSSEISPDATLAVADTTVTFRAQAYISVAVVSQPSHWLIIPGWIVACLGLLGLTVWHPERVWLQAQGERTRLLSDSPQLETKAMLLVGPAESEEPAGKPVVGEQSLSDPSSLPRANARSIGLRFEWLNWIAYIAWSIWTGLLIVQAINVYPRAASLTSNGLNFDAGLGAWLVLSGCVVVRPRRLRVVLIGVALVAMGLAVPQLLAL